MSNNHGFSSLVDYYRRNYFNPVPIIVEQPDVWRAHCAKRENLYERHLGIPLCLLRDRSVIEFGPNSGENALVLAMAGARLTLVEPNQQSLPRLEALFQRFGLSSRIAELRQEEISRYAPGASFDLVIAEGFLYTLPDRDALIHKIAGMLGPGGLGVISFNCRYGGFIESIKRLILWRACELAGQDVQAAGSLTLAQTLFGDDYERLNSSRPLTAWWKDTLVNPFYTSGYLWSFPELLPLLEAGGCSFRASSPVWNMASHFSWHKNTHGISGMHDQVLHSWRCAFGYILSGLKPNCVGADPAAVDVVEAVAAFVSVISNYTSELRTISALELKYPEMLNCYLSQSKDPSLQQLNLQLQEVCGAVSSSDLDRVLMTYRQAETLRSAWGTPYHYLSFGRT